MSNGNLSKRDDQPLEPTKVSAISSRTSLRASTMTYSGFSIRDAEPRWANDEPPTTRRDRGALCEPRIIRRAAMSVQRPEDILSACVGAELVAGELGLPPHVINSTSHIASELGQNLLRHAGGGTIAIAQLTGPTKGIELFAQDEGAGIHDVEGLLARPRNGQPERGLFGISRIADEFDIQSGPSGTHIRVVLYG